VLKVSLSLSLSGTFEEVTHLEPDRWSPDVTEQDEQVPDDTVDSDLVRLRLCIRCRWWYVSGAGDVR